MIIKGKYGEAKVYASVVDETTIEQVKTLMNQKFIKDSQVRIMADCHAGKGCVIGTTITLTDCCVPSLVGVDIGCGMLTVKLGKMNIDLVKLDRFIRKKIPSDNDVRSEALPSSVNINKLVCYDKIDNKDRIRRSLGTLGGGNHFIEIDKDDEDNLYLVVHSGSRNLGKQVCELYIQRAIDDWMSKKNNAIQSLIKRYNKLNKVNKIEEGLKRLKTKYDTKDRSLLPLYGQSFIDYIHDMKICQEFAYENRIDIATLILEHLGLNLNDYEYFQTIHNYINMDDMILRKGSISAYENEIVLIPINMRDGSILAKGKSNNDYNYSAPHGAGRILSRTKAMETVTLEQFKESMKGIYSTSVQPSTIDESPFAYKSIDDIIPNIIDTVEVIKIIKPIYNYKACKSRSR